jgi:2-methylcitrate dehydratase PrpD
MTTPTATLAAFAADLQFDDIPEPVIRKTEDLLVDWFGSVVAGHGARPVAASRALRSPMVPRKARAK